MSKQIYVNLPVKDLTRTVAFFTQLGFSFNPQFSNETASCMILSEDIFVMLLVEKTFQGFTKKEICDTATSTEVIVSLSADSRKEVDAFAEKALAAGAASASDPYEMDSMYGRSFRDLDGHLWEVFWMDASAMPPAN